ncbi:hypothetical protein F4677DRAFT_419238 [Hypoxylon crocopeplum]|nr:hypothetical protein F4677DRAFT_419238 [Hypoxylon crocopeplum]
MIAMELILRALQLKRSRRSSDNEHTHSLFPMSESAADIITYIGVPLAVIGVLPILYNVVRAYIVYFEVKSRLKVMRNRDGEIGLVKNYFDGDVEVKLPKFRVASLDREDSKYWMISDGEMLPGGSWELFSWNRLPSGKNVQRVRSGSQLRQPQAEVNFKELITYLLDLGMIPDTQGWKSLRSSGIWTPIETCLMATSDKQPMLSVAPLDTLDLNGRLSLKAQLHHTQVTNDKSSQAPDWIRLAPKLENMSGAEDPEKAKLQNAPKPSQEPSPPFQAQPMTSNITEVEYTVNAKGLVSIEPPDIDIQHLQLHRGTSTTVWLSSAFTAYAASQNVLMAYRIPESILDFSHSYSVPCGVLVLLGITKESDSLHWGQDGRYGVCAASRGRKWQPSISSPAQAPWTKEEVDKVVQERGDGRRQKQGEHEARIAQALQSRCWDVGVVAQHCLRWLNERTGQSSTREETVAELIYRVIQDEQLTASLGAMLSLWKSWSENGGLRRSDFHALQQDVEAFAYSALLLASIRDFDESLVANMQACFDEWKDVRLG